MDKMFGSINRSKKLRVNVTVKDFNNVRLLHIRENFLNDEGDWTPTKKGVVFSQTKQITDLIKFLQMAKKELAE